MTIWGVRSTGLLTYALRISSTRNKEKNGRSRLLAYRKEVV